MPQSAANAVAAAQADGKRHVLLGASGSVAVVKLASIVDALSSSFPPATLSIRIVLTESAARFFTGASAEQPTLAALLARPAVDGIYRDADEWHPPWRRGASILHIELRRWADVLVVAPLSANTLAKVAGGMCDNLLTSVVRAWDPARGTIVVAPAMNSFMWTNPATAKHLGVLTEEWGVQKDGGGGWFEVLKPGVKTLACGDEGVGAMVGWKEIVTRVELLLREYPS